MFVLNILDWIDNLSNNTKIAKTIKNKNKL